MTDFLETLYELQVTRGHYTFVNSRFTSLTTPSFLGKSLN